MRIRLAHKPCLPVAMSSSVISARYPTPNPWTSRCTTWDTGDGKRDHSPQIRCSRQRENIATRGSYCKKWETLGNGCVEHSWDPAVWLDGWEKSAVPRVPIRSMTKEKPSDQK